jgi:ubiquinone/menaquinone biosynthesis C-methylase UbiE
VTPGREVEAFDERAASYDRGWRGDLHHRIADRTAEIAMAWAPEARRILDVGCGTGYLLRRLAVSCPEAVELVGIDPAPRMIAVAKAAATDFPRLGFTTGVAERLPYAEGRFDLVVSSTSFDHWADQKAGIAELARVMTAGGGLVLTDRFSALLLPTLLGSHRGRARTMGRASGLFREAGFTSIRWRNLSGVLTLAGGLIRTVTATSSRGDPAFVRAGNELNRKF